MKPRLPLALSLAFLSMAQVATDPGDGGTPPSGPSNPLGGSGGGSSSPNLTCDWNIYAFSPNRLPSDYTSNGYDYCGAVASALRDSNRGDQMTTTFKYIANVYDVGDAPPPETVVFACDFDDRSSAGVSLGGGTPDRRFGLRSRREGEVP